MQLIKAVAVYPGQANSAHLREIPKPELDTIQDGRGVLVRVLRVGVDGTDKEILAAEYGRAPHGFDYLVVGHESLGVVEAVGPNVSELRPGDYVVPTVRRPGDSLYDTIGLQDMTTDSIYFERGINLLHGYLSEYYVESAEYLVEIPRGLSHVGVLLEPLSVVVKGICQALEIQRRLKVWRPKRAAVLGAGPIGLLAAMSLRLRGIDVTVFSLDPKPNHRAELCEDLRAKYISTREEPLAEEAARVGGYDIVLEATGASIMVIQGMQVLAKNGVLILTSITGGERKHEMAADKINLDFVLGNKLMVGTVNASRQDFVESVRDMALCEASYPGWLSRILSHPVEGIANFEAMYTHLHSGALKSFLQLA